MMKSGTKLCYSNIHTYMDLQRFDLDKNFFTPHEERRPKLEMLHMVMMMSKAILMSNSVINCPNSRHLGSRRQLMNEVPPASIKLFFDCFSFGWIHLTPKLKIHIDGNCLLTSHTAYKNTQVDLNTETNQSFKIMFIFLHYLWIAPLQVSLAIICLSE